MSLHVVLSHREKTVNWLLDSVLGEGTTLELKPTASNHIMPANIIGSLGSKYFSSVTSTKKD